MSRVGKKPITLPKGVEVKVDAAGVHVKGPRGTVSAPVLEGTTVAVKDGRVDLGRASEEKRVRAFHGLNRALVANAGAPNVVIVLIDDMGFGVTETFGGPIPMPTLDKLANNGLKYNRFHTTSLCSPTRVALNTGYNHHSNNAGSIMETSTDFPGNNAVRPKSITYMADVLRMNGFSTAAFGKWHETPPWQISVSGPQDQWPTGSGFEKFYGFIGGETNQWSPLVYDGVTLVETPKDPEYHFTTDMTDQAISWVRFQQALTPDKPFFIYYWLHSSC